MDSALIDKSGWRYGFNPALTWIQPEHLSHFFDRRALADAGAVVRVMGGRARALWIKEAGQELVLRHYQRGGLWGKLCQDRFFCFEPDARRAYLEFNLLLKMRALDLPVPLPVAYREQKRGLCWRQDLLIGALPHTRTLTELLKQKQLNLKLIAKAGTALQRCFKAGLWHSDLNANNILINDKEEVFIIDFDKCSLKNALCAGEIKTMLARLQRSFIKEAAKAEICFDPELMRALIKAVGN